MVELKRLAWDLASLIIFGLAYMVADCSIQLLRSAVSCIQGHVSDMFCHHGNSNVLYGIQLCRSCRVNPQKSADQPCVYAQQYRSNPHVGFLARMGNAAGLSASADDGTAYCRVSDLYGDIRSGSSGMGVGTDTGSTFIRGKCSRDRAWRQR